MNFIAIIGIVDAVRVSSENATTITIKVEKPYVDHCDEDWFDKVDVNLTTDIFSNDIKGIETGSIIGVKGRIASVNNVPKLIGERIQVF